MHDALERLLRQADAAKASPAPPDGLAGRIRRRRARRRAIRTAVVSASVSAAALAVTLLWVWGAGPSQPPGPPRVADAPSAGGMSSADRQARIAALDRQAAIEQSAVEIFLAGRQQEARLDELRRQLPELPDVDPLQDRYDRAARQLLLAADRLAYEMNDPQSAGELYRLIARQFPDTPAAQIARTKLSHTRDTLGEPS